MLSWVYWSVCELLTLCCSLIDAELRMSLKTVHLRSLSMYNPPDCFEFYLKVCAYEQQTSPILRVDPSFLAVSLQVPGGRLPLLSTRPAVIFPAKEINAPLADTKLYCLVIEAHRCQCDDSKYMTIQCIVLCCLLVFGFQLHSSLKWPVMCRVACSSLITLSRVSDGYISKCSVPSRSNPHF